MLNALALALTALIAAAGLAGAGCAAPSPSAQAHTTAAAPRVFGFRVTRADLDAPSYLFGSIHALPKGTTWLTPDVAGLLKGARALFVEVDTETIDPVALQQQIVQLGSYAPPAGLADALGSEDLERVVAAFEARHIPRIAVVRTRPWLLTLMLTASVLESSGLDGDGVDAQAMKAARAAARPVLSLESPGEQLELLAGMPADLAKKSLLELVSDPEAVRRALVDDVYAPWRAADGEGIARALEATDPDPTVRAYHRAVFAERNARMHGRLLPELPRPGSEVVVVGAGHLVGPDSLVELLRHDGFTVTPFAPQ